MEFDKKNMLFTVKESH